MPNNCYTCSGQPTIEEKALLFIKALDLGITTTGTPPAITPPSTTKPTITVPIKKHVNKKSKRSSPYHSITATRPSYDAVEGSIDPFQFQRRKRQIQYCPTNVHKICESSNRSKPYSVATLLNN